MKLKLTPILVFAVLVAATPALALLSPRETGEHLETLPSTTIGKTDEKKDALITVYEEGAKEALTLTEREYLIGAVVTEMPALYEVEALKAQAVAARSYALFVKELREKEPLPELKGGIFSVNTKAHTGYVPEAEARNIYGKNFSLYYDKIADAVDEVLEYAVTVDGKPICACYHAISTGQTEASENVFASALSYLVPVDSSFDEAAPGYLSSVVFSPSELNTLLTLNVEDFSLSGEPETWFGETKYSPSGNVTSVILGDRVFSGTEIRTLLNLRSAAFTVNYADSVFTFTVRGYGHGVGMSQNGANELAKRGESFKDILCYYYTGAAVEKY